MISITLLNLILWKKNHGISSDKAEREVIADSDDADKHEMNDKVNISIKSETETLNKNDLSGDILDKKKTKMKITLMIINQ